MDDEILHKNKKLNDKYEFLKRTLQFVFSASAFSLFVCYSSGFSVLPQSFNAYFSTCLLSMLAHTLERKYMFLICNLILAFLAKTSLFTPSSSLPPTSPYDDLESQPSNNIEYDLSNTYNKKEPVYEEKAFPLPSFSFRFPEKASPIVVEEELDEQVKTQLEEFYERAVSEAQGEEHDGTLVTQTEGGENDEASIAEEKEEEVKEEYIDIGDYEEGEITGSGVMVTRDDDNELANTTMATNELELANTEELNRKFEEFIRKMKEEIRIEAQTQPIAV